MADRLPWSPLTAVDELIECPDLHRKPRGGVDETHRQHRCDSKAKRDKVSERWHPDLAADDQTEKDSRGYDEKREPILPANGLVLPDQLCEPIVMCEAVLSASFDDAPNLAAEKQPTPDVG